MSRLIIQIPCFNEAGTLPRTFVALPLRVEGIGHVEVLVIDDGSTDGTADVARRLGVDHVIELGTHQGLARAFSAGLAAAVAMGADYVVNLDADNQYCATDIGRLLIPLLHGRADMVVGERPIDEMRTFSPAKKALQKLGSWVVRSLSGVRVRDTQSGFRAFTRRAAAMNFIAGRYTYTHESLFAAREADIRVVGVSVGVNEGVTRPSRLMRSTTEYVTRSTVGILRAWVMYRPAIAALVSGSVTAIGFLAQSHLALGAGALGLAASGLALAQAPARQRARRRWVSGSAGHPEAATGPSQPVPIPHRATG